jgi:Flp pilus assembly protein CpaB
MNTARIVILTIALSAGGVAAYLMRGYDDNKPLPAEPVSVKPDDLQWQTWPAAIASNSFIRRGDRPAGGFILTDIRDLAIDQAPKQKDRTNSLVGKIALLELRPEQSETLAQRARAARRRSRCAASPTSTRSRAGPKNMLRTAARASTWLATASPAR